MGCWYSSWHLKALRRQLDIGRDLRIVRQRHDKQLTEVDAVETLRKLRQGI
jgi:hypothetical protein